MDTIIVTLNNEDNCLVLSKILDLVEQMKPVWKRPRIFIDKELDPEQTQYEKMSNNCEIGVISRSKTSGYILLSFLRMIIDENITLVTECLLSEDEYNDGVYSDQRIITADNAIQILKEPLSVHTDIFKLTDTPTSTLIRIKNDNIVYTNIERPIKDIDIWDISRIRRAINKMLLKSIQ